MSDFTGVQWQPISQLPVFEELIGRMLVETLAFHATLAGAVGRPQSLDDATLDRVQQQYRERAEFLDLYDEQFRRWRAAGLTPEQARLVDGFSAEVQRTRPVVAQVLGLNLAKVDILANSVNSNSAVTRGTRWLSFHRP